MNRNTLRKPRAKPKAMTSLPVQLLSGQKLWEIIIPAATRMLSHKAGHNAAERRSSKRLKVGRGDLIPSTGVRGNNIPQAWSNDSSRSGEIVSSEPGREGGTKIRIKVCWSENCRIHSVSGSRQFVTSRGARKN